MGQNREKDLGKEMDKELSSANQMATLMSKGDLFNAKVVMFTLYKIMK